MNNEPTFDPRRKSAIRDLIVTTARTSTSRSRRGRGRRVAAVATLVVLALGISSGVVYALSTGILDPSPVASVTPTPSQTPTPAPATPAPTPTTPPTPAAPTIDLNDPSTWVIGFDGVGPVKLGSSFEEQQQTLPAFTDFTDTVCVGFNVDLQAPTGFAIRFIGSPDRPNTTAAITFGDGGSPVIDDRAATPKTAEGIGIDSTKEELLSTYPGIEKTGMYQSDENSYYGLSDGNGGWIVFAIINDTVGVIQIANESLIPYENNSVKTVPSERCPA